MNIQQDKKGNRQKDERPDGFMCDLSWDAFRYVANKPRVWPKQSNVYLQTIQGFYSIPLLSSNEKHPNWLSIYLFS